MDEQVVRIAMTLIGFIFTGMCSTEWLQNALDPNHPFSLFDALCVSRSVHSGRLRT